MKDEKTTPLRERMIEDMRIRGMSPKTQQGHIRAVRYFAEFIGRSAHLCAERACRRVPAEEVVSRDAELGGANAGLLRRYNTLAAPQRLIRTAMLGVCWDKRATGLLRAVGLDEAWALNITRKECTGP